MPEIEGDFSDAETESIRNMVKHINDEVADYYSEECEIEFQSLRKTAIIPLNQLAQLPDYAAAFVSEMTIIVSMFRHEFDRINCPNNQKP